MKIGILGAGIGSFHVELFKSFKEVESIVLFSRNKEKLIPIKEKFNIEITTDMDDIINNPSIELTDICLPTHLHKEYILKALSSGKHVFCETPLSYSLNEMNDILHAKNKYQKNVFINLFIQFSQAHQILHQAIKSNQYGKLERLSLSRKTPSIWGNLDLNHITTELMLHEIDFINWCFGKPNSILTKGNNGKKNQSYVLSILEYPDLIVEVYSSSMMSDYYPFTVSYEAIFENGVLQFLDEETIKGETKRLLEYTNHGKREINLDHDETFKNVIEFVVKNLNQKKVDLLNLETALETLQLTLEIKNQLITNHQEN